MRMIGKFICHKPDKTLLKHTSSRFFKGAIASYFSLHTP
ncbi:MAG: hypothetical protein WBB82_01325 [Limnothrix sp.]